ncbi:MAG TPA: hypothetical protein PLK99_07765 [Burkholderiales bacterium]|nr:hypothetical protein [Burkholderiales bacterium]
MIKFKKSLTACAMLLLCACSSLLPKGEFVTLGPWHSYQELQQVFDKIVPNKTTAEDLKKMGLDPAMNPNITILNYSDILRRFIPSPSINAEDLDEGVKECISAKTGCIGFEINQTMMKRVRYGNFWADFLDFHRKVDVVGWRFDGVILIRDNIVVYKLTGGEPSVHQFQESNNPLGPLQGIGASKAPGGL